MMNCKNSKAKIRIGIKTRNFGRKSNNFHAQNEEKLGKAMQMGILS